MTKEGIELIKQFEGCKLKAYKPVSTEKYYTIGYGHYGVEEGLEITQEQAEKLLIEDITKIEKEVSKILPPLTPKQWDAVISFCYNLGVYAFKNSTLYKKIKNNPNDEVSIREQWMRWIYAGGKKLLGLVKRRKAECDLYFSQHNNKS